MKCREEDERVRVEEHNRKFCEFRNTCTKDTNNKHQMFEVNKHKQTSGQLCVNNARWKCISHRQITDELMKACDDWTNCTTMTLKIYKDCFNAGSREFQTWGPLCLTKDCCFFVCIKVNEIFFMSCSICINFRNIMKKRI